MSRLLSSHLPRPRWRRRRAHAAGQALVEYALILAVLAILCIAVFTTLGNRVIYVFSAITSLLDTAQSS